MKRNLISAAAVIIILVLAYYWLIYQDIRPPWQKLTRFEKEAPGCVAGISSGDYAPMKLPTGFRHFYLAWGESFQPRQMNKADLKRGDILVLSWEPYLKTEQEGVLLVDIAGGKYDGYMAAVAASLKKYGGPVMVRWGQDPNGDQYAWIGAKNGNSPETYKKAWRRMAGILRSGAGPRAKLIFSVNGEDKPPAVWNRLENYYPGAEYADAVGLDIYNRGNATELSKWRPPHRILRTSYRRAQELAPDKPVFITEVATSPDGVNKAVWTARFLNRLEARYRAVKGFIWFDYEKECDWRISSDPAAAAVYSDAAAEGYFKADGGRLNWFFGE